MNSFLPKHLLARCYSHSAVRRSASQKWDIPSIPSSMSLFDDSGPVDLSEDSDIVDRVRRTTPPIHRRKPPKTPTPDEHTRHRMTLKKIFPNGWNPPRKISREAMDGLRQLHQHDPNTFTTPILAEKFKISPEAVRRILKGKWEPSTQRRKELQKQEITSKVEMVRLSRLREKLEMERHFGQRREERQATRGEAAGVDSKDIFTFG